MSAQEKFFVIDKRKADRNKVSAPIILVDERGDEWITNTIDISRTGLSFIAPHGFLAFGNAIYQIKIISPFTDKICMTGFVEIRGRRVINGQYIYGVETKRFEVLDDIYYNLSSTKLDTLFEEEPKPVEPEPTLPERSEFHFGSEEEKPAENRKAAKPALVSSIKSSPSYDKGTIFKNMILGQIEMSLFDINNAKQGADSKDPESLQQLYRMLNHRLEGLKDLINQVELRNQSKLSVASQKAEQLFRKTDDEALYQFIHQGQSCDEAMMQVVCANGQCE